MQLKMARVDTYYRQKLLLKSFYGFLKILEAGREQRLARVEQSQNSSMVLAKVHKRTESQSPASQNRFKRNTSHSRAASRGSKGRHSQQ